MSSTTIAWSETAPANSDIAGFGASQIRSLKTALSTGLGREHVWPTSTGLAGAHAQGSARVYVGDASTLSSGDTDGRMMWVSGGVGFSPQKMFYNGSEQATHVIGGRCVLMADQMLTPLGSLTSHYFSVEFGEGTLGISKSSVRVNFQSDYSGQPYVQVTNSNGNANGSLVFSALATASYVSVYAYDGATGALASPSVVARFNWQSIGSRRFA